MDVRQLLYITNIIQLFDGPKKIQSCTKMNWNIIIILSYVFLHLIHSVRRRRSEISKQTSEFEKHLYS